MKRNYCEICGEKDLKIIYTIENMPVQMGVSENNKNYIYNDLIYVQCQYCKNIQIYDLVNPEVIYQENHNKSIVGEIWVEHNLAFSNFIENNLKNKTNIFEIGDPSAKIASKLVDNPKIISWDIIEPQPKQINLNKVNIINDFFDYRFKTDKIYDLIVLSHAFEHLIDYDFALNKMYDILSPDGKIIISVPNMQYNIDSNSMPPLHLQFEHTVFWNETNIIEKFKKFNLKLKSFYEFKKHSYFYVFSKKNCMAAKFENLMPKTLSENLINTFETKKLKLLKLNELYNTGNFDSCFIYGAHIQSQMFLKIGLDAKIITGILDNDKFKHSKFLYGYDLMTYDLDKLNNYKKPLILCDMGVYNDEIKNQIKINYPHAEFI